MAIPGFLTKTFEIFSSSQFSDCCGWGSNGETIIIRKIEEFSKNILPKYFKHSNFQSFVRQLNMYDFHKTVQDPNHGEFTHQYFRQHKPELLVYIKRKANKISEISTPINETSKFETLLASAAEIHSLTMFDTMEIYPKKNDSIRCIYNSTITDDRNIYNNLINNNSFYNHMIDQNNHLNNNGSRNTPNNVPQIETILAKLENDHIKQKHQLQEVKQKNRILEKKIRKIINYIKKRRIMGKRFQKLS